MYGGGLRDLVRYEDGEVELKISLLYYCIEDDDYYKLLLLLLLF